MTEPVARKSDLGVRVLSAVVMVAVAGTALWLGGWVFGVLAIAVGFGVYWEWCRLVSKFAKGALARTAWVLFGLAYIGIAVAALITLRMSDLQPALLMIGIVIAVDIGAYFFGRTIGGPKIAPKISPSKTWAGLLGGVTGAAMILAANDVLSPLQFSVFHQVGWPTALLLLAATAAIFAVVAQAGDFFESWMKRRAGVKDSGSLIPGHGGLFDRVDGLVAVLFLGGLVVLTAVASHLAAGGSLLPSPA